MSREMRFSCFRAMLQVDAMINGRRRDHGAERAHIEVSF
jgi:hypothetical protein